ncbi:MAG: response regulator transcription factor [Paludibacteraceae bacterium]|nr:response regulator transcription factor [Paludibacteraceae bacterium]
MKKGNVAILVCEDDVNYGMLLCDFLRSKNYEVKYAKTGEEGWKLFSSQTFDFCILDVMIPQKNGFELAADIRNTGSLTPILFLTARTATEDILHGYAVGCDDYVLKPISMDVLLCKIEAILQRTHRQLMDNTTTFQLGSMTFDSIKQILSWEGGQKHLSSRESDLLTVLSQNTNHLVERTYILKTVWHDDSYFCSRSLSVYINHLRGHLAVDPEVKIMSVHGKGYKIVVPE